MRTVAACLITFRRPDLLSEALASLRTLAELPSQWRLEKIVVVDNDPAGSSVEVCRSIDGLPVPIEVVIEPRPGISHARNTAIEVAGTDYVAFLDDDERARSNWLSGLLETCDATGAPAVVGRVLNDFRPSEPPWARSGRVYERLRLPEGAPSPGLSSSNLLLRCNLADEVGILFDPRFGLLGGSDHQLGLRLRAQGIPIVHSARSEVDETLGPDRYATRALMRRWTRIGNTFVLTDLSVSDGLERTCKRLRHLAASVARLVLGSMRASAGVARRQRGDALRGAEMACRGVGGLMGVLGATVTGYPRPRL